MLYCTNIALCDVGCRRVRTTYLLAPKAVCPVQSSERVDSNSLTSFAAAMSMCGGRAANKFPTWEPSVRDVHDEEEAPAPPEAAAPIRRRTTP